MPDEISMQEAVLVEKPQDSQHNKGKILFVIPGLVGIMGRPTSPHFGVAQLAGVARDICHFDVKIIDMRLGHDD